ncbi:MAG: DUF1016 N-terminal domain-containing protein [Candidatus Binatia bacterium]
MKGRARKKPAETAPTTYPMLIGGIGQLLESARHATARAVNSLMTATYWEVGRRIVEFEQGGKKRAGYGEELLSQLAVDLTAQFGRGFSYTNLKKYRQFYLAYPVERIGPTLSGQSGRQFIRQRRENPGPPLARQASNTLLFES